MVLTRAFACATPVVASDIDGLPRGDDARDRPHRPAGRPAALADAVDRAARGRAAPACELGHAARGWRSERYAWDGHRRRLVDVYERALGAHARGPRVRLPRSHVGAGDAGASRRAARRSRRPALVARPGLGDSSATPSTRVRGVGLRRDRLNLLSVIVRSLAWRDRDRAGAAARRSRASARLLGVLGRAARERRPAGADRRARARRRARPATCRGGRAQWATLLGTVFAHRLFDLVPVLLLVVYVLADREDPALGRDEPESSSPSLGVAPCSTFAVASAHRHHRPLLDELGHGPPAAS